MTNKAKSGGASATAKAKSVRKQPLKAAAAAAPLPGQKKRKGPPQPAKECPDERHAGIDGNMYESRSDKTGRYRWALLYKEDEESE